jgi:hypothetical protein
MSDGEPDLQNDDGTAGNPRGVAIVTAAATRAGAKAM